MYPPASGYIYPPASGYIDPSMACNGRRHDARRNKDGAPALAVALANKPR